MSFRLVDSGWGSVIGEGLGKGTRDIQIVCPFIKHGAVERLLKAGRPKSLRVITRFNLCDFANGVSDTAALRMLLNQGARIRGIRHLHAKLYLFGNLRAIVTSANLTSAGLDRNHEFGCVAEDAAIVAACQEYFEDLWTKGKVDLTEDQLALWEEQIAAVIVGGARPTDLTGLGDEGVDAGIAAEPVILPIRVADAEQAFVKFFGDNHNRADDRSMRVFDEVKRSGSHRACTFPKGKRPRAFGDGAILYMGRMVKDPADILIYGRAIGSRHREGRDDATAADIALRPWKAQWPHYVRVRLAEFINGVLADGVSLNELMSALGADSFVSTQRNAKAGAGNTDPRRAYMRQASVALTSEARVWLNERLEKAYALHGKVPASFMDTLDWPDVTWTQT